MGGNWKQGTNLLQFKRKMDSEATTPPYIHPQHRKELSLGPGIHKIQRLEAIYLYSVNSLFHNEH